MTLSDANEGQWLVVEGSGSDEVTWQALRFGIEEGAELLVSRTIPGGPVIVSRNQLEIAIGRQIAAQILVSPLKAGEVADEPQ